MSNSSVLEFMSQQLPTVYKNLDTGAGGQKVVCTPEVSLYQYSTEAPSNRLDEKVHLDLGNVTRVPEPGSNEESPTGSTTSPTGFQCGFCGKTFQQKNTFQNHLRSHREGEDPYQCDICHKTFAVPARLTRHYRTHTGEKPYQCEYCNKSFSVKENLSVHRRIHTKERPYKCEVCERAFEHSGKLHRHMRIHTGERPHRCQICQKTFIQSGQLVIHMRTHTGEKPYVCKVCNKGFTCSKQLKVHTRTHTGEKPYTCDICGKSFGYNHVLKLHQVAHYGEKVYKCTLCNGTFTSKKSLESHIKTHSEGSVPTDPSSPNGVEPGIPSPSSLSQTPQNSDKENRETSDSEISTHSPNLESPKTPPTPDPLSKPSILHNYPRGQTGGVINREMYNKAVSNGNAQHPYSMLPPSIQVHQNPQSRTTFLYVTSKLPVPLTNGPSSRSSSPPPRHNTSAPPPTAKHPITSYNNNPNSFKGFGGLLSNGIGSVLSKVDYDDPPAHRDKLFLANASIRDKKVLPFLEQFGYGLPKDSNDTLSNRKSSNNYEIRERDSASSRPHKDMATVHPIPDSFWKDYTTRSPSQELRKSPIRYNSEESNSRGRSPDDSVGYMPGGVLALALTRGSKAVMQNSQFMSSNANPRRMSLTPPRSNTESPDLGLDYSSSSRRSSSPSRHSMTSLTPPSTSPRSSPGLEDYSEDGHTRSEEEMNNNEVKVGSKRRFSASGGAGPRKRSSLILEKYAQENPATPSPQTLLNPESILSQRLRLSSVIQYAEKCS